MNIVTTCLNALSGINYWLTYPSLVIFLGSAILLTLKTRFIQLRGLGRFYKLIAGGVSQEKDPNIKTISSFHALFSAMATTIGMGNVVGPSIAISIGGPGALFWLLVYIFLSSVMKFIEVTFAVHTRTVTPQGDIIGGPTQYLKLVSPKLAHWYGFLTIFLFTGWSGLQVNTLASIWSQEGIPAWITGLLAAAILLIVVLGGVERIGNFASRAVPAMFIFYVIFAFAILSLNPQGLIDAVKVIAHSIWHPLPAVGGFAGAGVLVALREGIYKSIFITESGIGTSSIAHALADVEHPTDQGILALYSSFADIFLCSLSGLLTIVTGVWASGKLNNTLIYEAFKMHSPHAGRFVLIASVFLFVITSLIGNTYNGSQSFAAFTNPKFIRSYYYFAAGIAFLGALAHVTLLWAFMELLLTLVALPHIVGLLVLAFTYHRVIEFPKKTEMI